MVFFSFFPFLWEDYIYFCFTSFSNTFFFHYFRFSSCFFYFRYVILMALSWLFFVPVRSLRIFSFYSQVIMIWQFFFFHLNRNGDFKLISVRFIISSTTWSLSPKRFYEKPVTKTATCKTSHCYLFSRQTGFCVCIAPNSTAAYDTICSGSRRNLLKPCIMMQNRGVWRRLCTFLLCHQRQTKAFQCMIIQYLWTN